jgi:hypothetical protein
MPNREAGIDRSPHNVFRLTALLFASLLGAQFLWLVSAELVRPRVSQLPIDIASAAAAANQRDAASRAASIGAIRSDLWADAAFTYADLLWGEKKQTIANADVASTLLRARATLTRALRDGPHQSSAWLLLAALSSRFSSLGFDVPETLRMSYYTGPSEQALVPLRLRTVVRLDELKDIELQQFVSRDLRMLLVQNQQSVIARVYNVASPSGKRFLESTLKDIDPKALDSLQTAKPGQTLPD